MEEETILCKILYIITIIIILCIINYLKDYLPRFSGREGEGDMSAPTFLYSLNIQT